MVVDGNRRWAREAGLADVGEGHRRGSTHVAEVLRWCAGLGIDNVTPALASTRQWQDITDAVRALLEDEILNGSSLQDLPAPDLMIRTNRSTTRRPHVCRPWPGANFPATIRTHDT